jgi:hypothetical protein
MNKKKAQNNLPTPFDEFNPNQNRDFGNVLSYHAPRAGWPPTASFWELKPGFKEMVGSLGKINSRIAAAKKAWRKVPKGAREDFDRRAEAWGQEFDRLDGWLAQYLPACAVFFPEDKSIPFLYFPWSFKKKDDARLFGAFMYELSTSRNYTQGGGGPKGTRALTIPEQKLAEKMRRRGMGTEAGSIRFIAEELRERGNRKKQFALIQDIKRHFRRTGLIRSK